MKLLLVHDKAKQSATALAAVVAAVARARAEGMFVDVEAEHALDPSAVPVPSVRIDGVLAEGVDEISIYNAIARAHRCPERLVGRVPRARMR